jgi:hypothetical protein
MTSYDGHRWYDRDPVLKQALETLRHAPDSYQAQVALNIIVIIVEHQIESETLRNVDDLVQTLLDSKKQTRDQYRRWYDLNETLRSALQLLKDCPEEVQQQVIPSISKMVEDSLAKID